MSTPNTRLSPIADAARQGLPFGLVLTAVLALWVGSVYYSLLIVLFLVCLPLPPVVAYRSARGYATRLREGGVEPPFMLLWAHTQMLYFFGSLVLMLPMYYCVQAVFPDVFALIEQTFARTLAESPEQAKVLTGLYGEDPLSTLSQLRQVSVWTYLTSTLYMNILLGSVLGLLNALLIKMRKK